MTDLIQRLHEAKTGKRCRHLGENALITKITALMAELEPYTPQSPDARRARAMYGAWADALRQGGGEGYRYIDRHHDELVALTWAVLRPIQARREGRELEGDALLAAVRRTFPDAGGFGSLGR